MEKGQVEVFDNEGTNSLIQEKDSEKPITQRHMSIANK
jgi:hypothetical protein